MTIGQLLTGKVSWFGGPHDPTSGPTTASGSPISAGGIAVYNRETLGGYWRVTFPNGRAVVLRQTDIGPAPWTGKLVDVAYSSLAAAGYSESTFPTGATVKAIYLGKANPGNAAASSSTSSTSHPATSATSTTKSASSEGISDWLFGLGEKASIYLALVVVGVLLIGFGGKAGLGPRPRELQP